MPEVSLAVSGLVQWTAACAFLAVARTLRRRPVAGDTRLANDAFVLWWAALSAYMLIQGGFAMAAAAGWTSLGLLLVTRGLTVPLLCAAAWGLSFHVTYLYTGWRRAAAWLGALYAVVGAVFLVAIGTAGPHSVRVGQWIVDIATPGALPVLQVVYVAVGGPPIVATLFYLSLVRRIEDAMQRYRVVLVSAAILAWVGGGLATRLGAGETLIFVTLVLFGLGAAAAVWFAYNPPRFVVAWLDRGRRGGDGDGMGRERAQRDFRERMAALV